MQLIPTLCSPQQVAFALFSLQHCNLYLPCHEQLASVICVVHWRPSGGIGVPKSRTQTSRAVTWAAGPHATPVSIMYGREKELAKKKAKAVDTAVAMQDCWNDLKWLFQGYPYCKQTHTCVAFNRQSELQLISTCAFIWKKELITYHSHSTVIILSPERKFVCSVERVCQCHCNPLGEQFLQAWCFE